MSVLINKFDKAILDIIELTKYWDLKIWKDFRSFNNYWEVKDSIYASKNELLIHEFRIEKIKWIKEYKLKI